MAQRFAPPGFVAEFDQAGLDAWHQAVLAWFREAEAGLPAAHRFFNLVDTPEGATAQALIPWNGFPRKFSLLWPTEPERRWRHVRQPVSRDLDGRAVGYYVPNGAGQFVPAGLPFRDQDEYCEWHDHLETGTDRLLRITFSCENPEYWALLAETDPDLLVRLYRELVDPAVQHDDLFFAQDIFRAEVGPDGTAVPVNQRGRYNPYNRWNVLDGIVHLTHPANSLQAEILLAADATLLRADTAGQTITDDGRLICCAGYGNPNRSSDPTIGGRVNALVRAGNAVTIDNPVGLYIGGIDLAAVELPDGGDPAACWRVLRGRAADRLILRAEFRPPDGVTWGLEQVMVGGEPLRYGGQLAELVTMVIHGRGKPTAGQAPTEGCRSKCCQVPAVPTLLSLVQPDAACPPLSPVADAPLDASGTLAALAANLPVNFAAGGLPDPRRRI